MAIAFFFTWTTYGTWLPGDDRGWYQNGRLHLPDFCTRFAATLRMTDQALILNTAQRKIVEYTITENCKHRHWILHAVNCRTNHVHVAVTAPGADLHAPRKLFKTWCTLRFNQHADASNHRKHWWTHRGWDEYVDTAASLETVVSYIRDGQDLSKR